MVYCKKCGTKVKEGYLFCSKCGLKVKKLKEEKEPKKIKKVEAKHIAQGISKNIFYSVLIISIISLIVTSGYINKYVNEFYDMKNLYSQQKSETDKYKKMYEQEANVKQQEIRKRQEAEAETSQVTSELYSEQQRLSNVQKELSSTKTELEQTQEQVSVVKKEVEDIVYTLNNLESWVDENALLPYDKLSNIHNSCGTYIDVQENNCIIDAKQMGQDMKICLRFYWVDDKITSNFGTGERIFDIDTFWQSKEGDCDDFALFFASWLRTEYNHAKAICGEKSIYIKLDESKFIKCPCDIYSVCGAYGNSGHCETGVSQTSYKPSEGYTFFSNLYIIEPQNGGYGGTSLEEFKNVWEFFSENDFASVSDYKVSRSIQSAKIKLQNINI